MRQEGTRPAGTRSPKARAPPAAPHRPSEAAEGPARLPAARGRAPRPAARAGLPSPLAPRPARRGGPTRRPPPPSLLPAAAAATRRSRGGGGGWAGGTCRRAAAPPAPPHRPCGRASPCTWAWRQPPAPRRAPAPGPPAGPPARCAHWARREHGVLLTPPRPNARWRLPHRLLGFSLLASVKRVSIGQKVQLPALTG